MSQGTTCKCKGIGAILGAISGGLYATAAALVKLINHSVNATMVSCVVSVVIVLSCSLALSICRTSISLYTRRDYAIVVIVGILNGALRPCQFYAFQLTSISNAITIISSSPVCIILFNCISRRKVPCVMDILVLVTCVCGVVLCAQPDFIFKGQVEHTAKDALGCSLAVISALLLSSCFILLAEVKHMSIVLCIFIENLICLIILVVVLFATNAFELPEKDQDYAFLLLASFSCLLAMVLSYASIVLDSPMVASIGRSADIAASLVINYFVFGVLSNGLSVFGSVLIMLAIIMPPLISLSRDYLESATYSH